MIVVFCRVMTLIAAFLVGPVLAQSYGPVVNHIRPRIVAETSAPAAGSTVTIAIEMRTERGWHGYWSNPGEAGFAPRFDWTLPPGAIVGAPRFPVPRTLTIAGLVNYVFEADHALLLTLTIPAGLPKGTRLPLRAKGAWLACTEEVCVPEQGEFALDLTIGDSALDNGARFNPWRSALPAPLGTTAHFERKDGKLRLAIPLPADAVLTAPHVFPADNHLIVDAAPQNFSRDGDTLIVELALPPEAIGTAPRGVLAIGEGRGLEFTAQPGLVPAAGKPLTAASASPGWSAALVAFGGALLGGLILNIMPCVFPILSLKALNLAKAGGDEAAARRDALGYTLGAVLVCVGLGAMILALRSSGNMVGWAFQLQDARVILALLVLVVAVALNLAGLFELPTVGGGLATGNSIATGALAAFVATPCTGPFMAAALGAALVLPPAAALAVFAGLGLGLALPFLALGFVPALRQRLPRPGAWMATLRRILSVPMFVTALGLAWLLGRQGGIDALTLGLAAALAVALALWWAGLRQARGQGGLALAALASLALIAGAAMTIPASAPAAATTTTDMLASEPFSEARLAALRADNRPVFVYFTADWCLTCKVNERIAIDRPEVAAAFKAANVATLVGDWTRGDAAIGRFLTDHGRSGVPLYLFYPAGAAEPQVLPQILTPAMLTKATR